MDKHAHYYVIETGGTIGRCKCGEVKDFLPANQRCFHNEYGKSSKYWPQQTLYPNGGFYLQGILDPALHNRGYEDMRRELIV